MKVVFLLLLLVGQYVAMEVTKDLMGSPQRSPLSQHRVGKTTFESPPIILQLRPDDASSSSAPPPHRVLARQGDTDRKISELEEIVVEQEGSDAGIPNMVDTRTEAQVTARAKIQGIDPTPGSCVRCFCASLVTLVVFYMGLLLIIWLIKRSSNPHFYFEDMFIGNKASGHRR
ncbi:hypothetical protein PSTG_00223 [Puccinia striiformis f. sp. tritici PST-78]|uniref:Uncharacterized protein n=1 Tax=Puccinia striiformis f. sp. tritici PST-78 TaxID=1165861 RepID=A0A0L0W5W6_9BASI|nr:hypothetical protein PSTG_00223 [Puccinia striiformis f. sp. tritici PST-78]